MQFLHLSKWRSSSSGSVSDHVSQIRLPSSLPSDISLDYRYAIQIFFQLRIFLMAQGHHPLFPKVCQPSQSQDTVNLVAAMGCVAIAG